MDYGPEDVCLVAVMDIPQETHAALAAETDCTALPEDISAQIGGQVNQVQNALESFNLPAGWVTNAMTFRQVLRIVGAACQFMQRWAGMGGGKIFTSGVTLDTRRNALPAAARNRVVAVYESFGYDQTILSTNYTIRGLVKDAADQYKDLTIFLGDVEL